MTKHTKYPITPYILYISHLSKYVFVISIPVTKIKSQIFGSEQKWPNNFEHLGLYYAIQTYFKGLNTILFAVSKVCLVLYNLHSKCIPVHSGLVTSTLQLYSGLFWFSTIYTPIIFQFVLVLYNLHSNYIPVCSAIVQFTLQLYSSLFWYGTIYTLSLSSLFRLQKLNPRYLVQNKNDQIILNI